jgi:putative N6-adenine-specific DNA methylase
MDDEKRRNAKALARRIRIHAAGKPHRFFAVVQPGFEELALDELRGLGIAGACTFVEGGVEFEARLDGCYRANLASRVITRVLMRLDRFAAVHFDRLRAKTAAFPWELYLSGEAPAAFSVSCSHSRLYHTGRIEEEVLAGIGERLASYGLALPADAGDDAAARQTIYVRFDNDLCELSLDSSGAPLYRRGYKTHVTQAPLRETIAAALLRASGIERCGTLIDPMCGSGSFSIEAALIWSGIPSGGERSFAFELWPAFRPAAFAHLKRTLSPDITEAPAGKTIHCADIDPAAVEAAGGNARRAGMEAMVRPLRADFFTDMPNITPGAGTLLVLNPPYGERIPRRNLAAFYRRIGETVRTRYAGCAYCVIVPGIEIEKALSLPWDRKIVFMNGGIRVAAVIKQAP